MHDHPLTSTAVLALALLQSTEVNAETIPFLRQSMTLEQIVPPDKNATPAPPIRLHIDEHWLKDVINQDKNTHALFQPIDEKWQFDGRKIDLPAKTSHRLFKPLDLADRQSRAPHTLDNPYGVAYAVLLTIAPWSRLYDQCSPLRRPPAAIRAFRECLTGAPLPENNVMPDPLYR